MSETIKKLDDNALALDDMANAPEVSGDAAKIKKEVVKEPVKEAPQSAVQPLRVVPDDPETDARNTRLLVKTINTIRPLDGDIKAAIEEFGQNLWPLLRMTGIGWRAYTIMVGGLLMAPMVPSSFRIIQALLKKEEKSNDTGNS